MNAHQRRWEFRQDVSCGWGGALRRASVAVETACNSFSVCFYLNRRLPKRHSECLNLANLSLFRNLISWNLSHTIDESLNRRFRVNNDKLWTLTEHAERSAGFNSWSSTRSLRWQAYSFESLHSKRILCDPLALKLRNENILIVSNNLSHKLGRNSSQIWENSQTVAIKVTLWKCFSLSSTSVTEVQFTKRVHYKLKKVTQKSDFNVKPCEMVKGIGFFRNASNRMSISKAVGWQSNTYTPYSVMSLHTFYGPIINAALWWGWMRLATRNIHSNHSSLMTNLVSKCATNLHSFRERERERERLELLKFRRLK